MTSLWVGSGLIPSSSTILYHFYLVAPWVSSRSGPMWPPSMLAEVGKVTLKSNGDEALNDEFLFKSKDDEALNDGFP
jgi:hypothetical protein